MVFLVGYDLVASAYPAFERMEILLRPL